MQHYKHIVIKYSHVRLKITTRYLTISQRESLCLRGDWVMYEVFDLSVWWRGETLFYCVAFRPACSASRCDRASFHRLKKAWRQLDMTCKWNKARPNWPKSTVSFTRHCGQSGRHGGKLPRCRRQIRGLRVYIFALIHCVTCEFLSEINSSVLLLY